MMTRIRRTSVLVSAAAVGFGLLGPSVPGLAVDPAPAGVVVDEASILATASGYRYVAGSGQDNDILVWLDGDNLMFNDKALTSFGSAPATCTATMPAEGVGWACALASRTAIVRFDLGDGDDWLDGGTGEEVPWLPPRVSMRVYGGPGLDVVMAGDGDDRIFGGEGDNDTLYGGPGDDLVSSGPGTSYLRGHAGNDVLIGGPDFDFIFADQGKDVLEGHGGIDYMRGGAGADVLRGGASFDSLTGNRGPDKLFGGADGDSLAAGPGRDQLHGGGGDDELGSRDHMRDDVSCGAGADIARVDAGELDVTADCETVRKPQS